MMGRIEMKRLVLGGAASALGLLLSGCGGGGGVASTPPPTYTKLADLTGNRTFQSAGVHFALAGIQPSAFSVQKYGAGVTIAYNASNDSYTLTAPGGATETFSSATSTPPPGYVPPPNTVALFNSAAEVFGFQTASVNGVALSYTALGGWAHFQNGLDVYSAVAGVPTIASDMPRNGTANYQTSISGQVYNNGGSMRYDFTSDSSATFSANFGAGTVDTTLHLVGSQPNASAVDFGSYSGNGTIASGSPGFSGTLASTASSPVVANGEFAGAFFGPQAKEMGYGFYAIGSGMSAEGLVVGTK
jgi:hypothetical protein